MVHNYLEIGKVSGTAKTTFSTDSKTAQYDPTILPFYCANELKSRRKLVITLSAKGIAANYTYTFRIAILFI